MLITMIFIYLYSTISIKIRDKNLPYNIKMAYKLPAKITKIVNMVIIIIIN